MSEGFRFYLPELNGFDSGHNAFGSRDHLLKLWSGIFIKFAKMRTLHGSNNIRGSLFAGRTLK